MILSDMPFGLTQAPWDKMPNLEALWIQYKRVIKKNGAILLFAKTPFDKILGCSNLEQLRYEWIWEKPQAVGYLNSKRMPLASHENILVFYEKLPTYNPQMTHGHTPVHSYTKKVDVQNRTELYGKTKVEISGGGETDRFPRSVIKFSSDKQKNKNTEFMHSTQKPLKLCEYLIKTYTNDGDIVLDSFCGSGTTGLAAQNLNRNFIMIEKEEKYYNMTKKRLNIT